jgi:hypothetical protein
MAWISALLNSYPDIRVSGLQHLQDPGLPRRSAAGRLEPALHTPPRQACQYATTSHAMSTISQCNGQNRAFVMVSKETLQFWYCSRKMSPISSPLCRMSLPKRNSLTRFSTSVFFHESNLPCPLIRILQPFQILC